MFENRRSYRLPFRAKFVFSTTAAVFTGNTQNISVDGAFVATLETTFERDTAIRCLFSFREGSDPVWLKGSIVRISSATSDPTVIPGVGIKFHFEHDHEREAVENFIAESRRKFELAGTILSIGEPDIQSLAPLLSDLHLPPFLDLGELRVSVDRVIRSIELTEKYNAARKG